MEIAQIPLVSDNQKPLYNCYKQIHKQIQTLALTEISQSNLEKMKNSLSILNEIMAYIADPLKISEQNHDVLVRYLSTFSKNSEYEIIPKWEKDHAILLGALYSAAIGALIVGGALFTCPLTGAFLLHHLYLLLATFSGTAPASFITTMSSALPYSFWAAAIGAGIGGLIGGIIGDGTEETLPLQEKNHGILAKKQHNFSEQVSKDFGIENNDPVYALQV